MYKADQYKQLNASLTAFFENHLNIKNCPMMTHNIYIPRWNRVLIDGNPFKWLAPKATLMTLYNNLSLHFVSRTPSLKAP